MGKELNKVRRHGEDWERACQEDGTAHENELGMFEGQPQWVPTSLPLGGNPCGLMPGLAHRTEFSSLTRNCLRLCPVPSWLPSSFPPPVGETRINAVPWGAHGAVTSPCSSLHTWPHHHPEKGRAWGVLCSVHHAPLPAALPDQIPDEYGSACLRHHAASEEGCPGSPCSSLSAMRHLEVGGSEQRVLERRFRRALCLTSFPSWTVSLPG